MTGQLAIVLHAHLPFVRHPEHEDFLEEDWFYEAISETYLPLLEVFDRAAAESVPFRLTLSLSPTLVTMMQDPLLLRRYARRLDRLIQLSEREVRRTRDDPRFRDVTGFYRDRLHALRVTFRERYGGDLVGGFRELQDRGRLELITCCATHGFLPVLQGTPGSVRAQIKVAAQHYRGVFGRGPLGVWLSECGYYPGVESFLADEGIRYFFVDTHGIMDATPRPLRGVFAPLITEKGVAAFGRDPDSARQVWSKEIGYPGDPLYREFYRDAGYDLPLEELRDFVQGSGERRAVGLKYFRITGSTEDKQPYDPAAAISRAREHARHFCQQRSDQIRRLTPQLEGRAPIIVAPYDAELFGHWWFEGPAFLDALIRHAAFEENAFKLATPSDYLAAQTENQVAIPAASSWGEQGYAGMWLNESTDWMFQHLYHCALRMEQLAQQEPATALERRALNQAARELLLAQASDWPFILKTGTMVPYAQRRIREHVLRFLKLDEQLGRKSIDETWLQFLERRDPIFPAIDYRVFRPPVAAKSP